MSDDVELGPIDYLVVEYAHGKPTGEALPYLLDLVASGTIRILDLAMLVKDDETHFRSMKLADLPALGITDFDDLDGVESGLLSEDDLAEVAAIIEPGRAAAILIYENTWAGPFAAALRRAGASLVANGRINVNDLLAALQSDESVTSTD